jgi:lipopolysaccharide heptosyltransferase II
VKILLVRLRLIGDVVFTTPLVRALRQRYPDAHLTYLVEPLAEPIVRNNPHLSQVVVVPRRRGVARVLDDLRLARRLRRQRFDVAIDLHGGPRASWLTLASRAPTRIGYAVPGRTWMYTHPVSRAADLRPRHSVLNQWDLLGPLGIDLGNPSHDAVEMVIGHDTTAAVAHRLAAIGIGAEHPLVVVHVSAGNPFRRWPAESFARLIATLARQDPLRRFMVVSGPSDASAARRVADLAQSVLGPADAGHGGRPTVACGEFGVDELRALTARAAVYIGGDSGPLHIAATTTTPVVALFGPTLPERSMPWRDPQWFAEAVDAGPLPCRPCHQRQCAPGDFRCLARIAPERVAAAAERALAAARHTGDRRAHA